MNSQNGNNGAAKTIRSVREVIDAARVQDLVEGGMAEASAWQEIRESRRIGDLYDDLLAAGYTDEQVGVLWEGKTPREILAEADAKEVTPQIMPKSRKQHTLLNKAS